MSVYFTADFHFGHGNIIKYCNRPFKTVEEMNETIITNYNKIIGKSDVVYILGDFAFIKSDVNKAKEIYNTLNGNKILIKGNHDRINIVKQIGFAQIYDLKDIKIDNIPITLCHYAMRVWNKKHYNSWMLYAHSHGTLPEDPNAWTFDIGVDAWNFCPVSFEQVKAKMIQKGWREEMLNQFRGDD